MSSSLALKRDSFITGLRLAKHASSTFDLTQLQLEKRYKVQSKEIKVPVKTDKNRKRMYYRTRFDWVSVKELPLGNRTAKKVQKETKAAKELKARPLADSGDLFKW